MQFSLGIIAYVSAAVAGVKFLANVAILVATSAAPHIQLPPAKPSPAPTLVERRLMAQEAPANLKPLNRSVYAMDAPDIPVTMLAKHLDEAETAYAPAPQPRLHALKMVAAAMPQAHGQSRSRANKAGKSGKTRIASVHSERAAAKFDKLKQPFNSGGFKILENSDPSRFATSETPGYLMSKGLLNKSS